jgi:hypothetical protein
MSYNRQALHHDVKDVTDALKDIKAALDRDELTVKSRRAFLVAHELLTLYIGAVLDGSLPPDEGEKPKAN